MSTPEKFVMRFRAAAQRIQREVEGWTEVTREYTESMDQVNAWLNQRQSIGKGQAALRAAPDRLRPIYRNYAVGMESGTRQVTEALEEAKQVWQGSEDLWEHEPPEDVEELRESVNFLIEASQVAAHSTQGLRDGTKDLRDATEDTAEVADAITAAQNALNVCDEAIGFGEMALQILDRASGPEAPG